MSANAPDRAWPVRAGRPAIEVYYGLVSHAARPLAFWYRYTLLSTRTGHQEARLWAGLTDAERRVRSFFATERLPLTEARVARAPFTLDLGDLGRLTDRGASGAIDTPLGPVHWDLSWQPDSVVFTPLGNPLLTEVAVRGLGLTRHRSAQGAVRVHGRLMLGDDEVLLEDAPGHQGHTAGSGMASAWRWVQCNAFDDRRVALEALGVGPVVSGLIREGGRIHRLNRLANLVGPRHTRSEQIPGRWTFAGQGDGLRFSAEVRVDHALWRRVVYLAPDGSLRHNAHCSLAAVELTLERRVGRTWSEPEHHRSTAGRVEWVGRDPPVPGAYEPQDFSR